MERVDDAAHIAAQPIQTPDNEDVALPQVPKTLDEARPVSTGATSAHGAEWTLQPSRPSSPIWMTNSWCGNPNRSSSWPDFDHGALFGGVVTSVSFARICWIWASCAYMCAWICLASSNTAEASS